MLFSSRSLAAVALALAPVATFVAAPAMAKGVATPQQLEKNKQIALGLTAAMAERNVAKAASFLADGYIQHNPNVPTGKAGFIGFFGPRWEGKQLPARATLENPPVETIAEGDLVTFIFKDTVPDPVDTSKTYDKFRFDAYRIADGKIVEHWDGGERRAPAAATK